MKLVLLFLLVSCASLKPLDEKILTLPDSTPKSIKENFTIKEIVSEKKVAPVKEATLAEPILKEIPKPPVLFNPKIGNTLTYSVYAPLGIKAGTLITTVIGNKKLGNNDIVHIKANLYNSAFFASIFKVNLLIESFVDIYEFKSRRYQISGQEGSVFKENLELYDYDNKSIIESKRIKGKSTETVNTYPLEFNQVQDILSAFYYVKEHNYQSHPQLTFTIVSGKKIKNASAIKLRSEKFNGIDCLVLGFSFEKNQKHEDNLIWIDKDKNIHKIISSMKWGTFKIILD